MNYKILSIKFDEHDHTIIKIEFLNNKQKTLLNIDVSYEYFTMATEMSKWEVNPYRINDDAKTRQKVQEWIKDIVIPDFKLKVEDPFSQKEWDKYF